MPHIPRCMSTQHPDNVTIPFFASTPELAGEDEVLEAYYAFSHLGCDEQMWDCEGKEIDTFVVKKLLSRYEDFFREHRLGEDVRLTLRVPNPTVEKTEAKVLLETLESIPRSYDAARLFYGEDVTPIFEVILPMTTSATCIDRIFRYYRDFIVGRQDMPLSDDGVTVAQWIGEFRPARISVIPLFEDIASMLAAADITEAYLRDKDIADQRVFLARSDPAMNYGLVAAALANKVALARLDALAERTGVRIHPILGVGSAPFRGGLTPASAADVAAEYPSVRTFTIQSSFKYDNPSAAVRDAVLALREAKVGPAQTFDEEPVLLLIERASAAYRDAVRELAPAVNAVAKHVPRRRMRKLHIGLFGYAREMDGIALPRAISFTCALYSLGVPPEILGLEALDAASLAAVRKVYGRFDEDISAALAYCDPESPLLPAGSKRFIEEFGIAWEPDPAHLDITRKIAARIDSGATQGLQDLITHASGIRGFLG
ncbi:MAG: phosphoenolpyruvate carboxylase [Coriobacteriia bacterium]